MIEVVTTAPILDLKVGDPFLSKLAVDIALGFGRAAALFVHRSERGRRKTHEKNSVCENVHCNRSLNIIRTAYRVISSHTFLLAVSQNSGSVGLFKPRAVRKKFLPIFGMRLAKAVVLVMQTSHVFSVVTHSDILCISA